MSKTKFLIGTILGMGLATAANAQQATAGADPTNGANAPANATTPADATDVSPADIVVTAQKRSERLQDVPIAVSVVGGAALDTAGRPSIETATQLVPSLNFQKSGTTLNQSLYMRGVGTATFSIAAEPSVSTVVDGVVYARGGEAFSDLIDVDRMEVLRGPQGTLFGKNASAGAINIVTKRPGKTVGGFAEASYFTKSEYRARVGVDLPLSEGVRTRTVAFWGEYDGNIRNIAPNVNSRVNGYKRYGIRSTVVADISPDVQATIIGDWRRANDDCCAQIIGSLGTSASLAFSILPTPLEEESRTISQNLVTRTKETSWGLSLQLDTSVGAHSLTSITAYRGWDNIEIRDGDWLPQAYIGIPQLHDEGPQTAKTFSQEIRLASPTGNFIDYLIGAYYSNAENDRVFTRRSIVCSAAATPAPTVLTPCTSPLAAPSRLPVGVAPHGAKFDNMALFGNATINFTSALRGLLGLRYTRDELDVYHQRIATGLDLNAGGQPVGTGGINPSFGPFNASTKADNLSGRIGLQADITDDSMAYGTYTRGYKGPGFNNFFNLGATGTNFVEAETSDAWELGLKNSLLNGRVTMNLAAFYTKFDNFQANNPDIIPGNPPTVISRFTNAGKVSTRGVELDFAAALASGLSFVGGGAYTDAQVEAFKVPAGANPADVIPAGTPLLFAPKWKGSLGLDYRRSVSSDLDLFAGTQWSGQTKQLSIFSPNAVLRQRGTIEGYSLVNAQVGIGASNDSWKLLFQVRNLFDQSYIAHKESGGPAGSLRYQIARDADRYYGMTARMNFGGRR